MPFADAIDLTQLPALSAKLARMRDAAEPPDLAGMRKALEAANG